MDQALLANLANRVRLYYKNDDPGHDFAHIMRVASTCLKIGTSLGADLNVLLSAAFLHDVVNLPKDHPDRKMASQLAAHEGRKILSDLRFTETQIKEIARVVEEHSYSLGRKPSTLESAILQDADRLDALGAIGIMRTVTCGCRLGAAYYHFEEPIPTQRPLDDKLFTIDHFFVKLFKLPEVLNTAEAKAEAAQRISFMQEFLKNLSREIGAISIELGLSKI